MASQRKQPTNADIMNKLEEFGDRLRVLEDWHVAVEAAKEALKQQSKGDGGLSNKALVAVIGALASLSAIVITLVNKL